MQDTSKTSKTIAVFDFDGTITDIDTYIAFLAGFLMRNPTRTMRAAWLPLAVVMHKLSIRDNSWLKEVFLRSIAGGTHRYQLDPWCQQFIHSILKEHIRPGAQEAIKFHRSAGHELVLITASFDFYTTHIAEALGFDHLISTRADWGENDVLTGLIDGRNCYGVDKINRLKSYFNDDRSQLTVVAYSDHHSDIPLLQWADKPIAVNPTKKLRQYAVTSGTEIMDWGIPG